MITPIAPEPSPEELRSNGLMVRAIAFRSIHVTAKYDINGVGSNRPFVLKKGWAFQQHVFRDGRRQIIGLLLPGQCHLAITNFAITACTDCVIDVPERPSWPLFRASYSPSDGGPDYVTSAYRWLIAFGCTSAESRVSFLLCEIARLVGHRNSEGFASFHMMMTQQDIADVCCVTAIHVNRIKRNMEKSGFLYRNGRQFTLVDHEALKRICEFEESLSHLTPLD